MPIAFARPGDSAALEEGVALTPRFDRDGLVAAIAVDDASGEVLMLAFMNAQALSATLETGIAHYWSRSRGRLWRKGDTSGQTQSVVEMRVDCDQDAILMRVKVGGDGGACHTGRDTCFYRAVTMTADGPRLKLAAPLRR